MNAISSVALRMAVAVQFGVGLGVLLAVAEGASVFVGAIVSKGVEVCAGV
jgi:hypothetical protein